MTHNCPHCGGDFEITIAATAPPPAPAPEEWLEPSILAYRIDVGEAYVRKLINLGLKLEEHGFERRGGRLYATMPAVQALRRV